MYKAAVYTLVNGIITHQKQQISKKMILLSSTLTLRLMQSRNRMNNVSEMQCICTLGFRLVKPFCATIIECCFRRSVCLLFVFDYSHNKVY